MKLTANESGDTLTVVNPEIEKKTASDRAQNQRMRIKAEEPKPALHSGIKPDDT